jgi:hypothetical protein
VKLFEPVTIVIFGCCLPSTATSWRVAYLRTRKAVPFSEAMQQKPKEDGINISALKIQLTNKKSEEPQARRYSDCRDFVLRIFGDHEV